MTRFRALLTSLTCLTDPAGADGKPWPFCADPLMPDETVLFSSDVEPRRASLLFRPTRIRTVTSADGTRTYEEGADYRIDLERGVLTLPPGSRIPCPQLYGGEGGNFGRFRNRAGETMLFAEGDLFHSLQVRVAYEHRGDEWAGKSFIPPDRSEAFPGLHRIRRTGGELRLALIGDSISAGSNASGFVGASPGRPPFGEQVAEALRTTGKVGFRNLSRGGASASWGRRQLPKLADFRPDLVMIAFGMNDARRTGRGANYERIIREMVGALHEAHPQVEILLIANMLPNQEFSPHSGHFENLEALRRIAASFERVAVADVMSVTRAMLERKKFADICGNHVNHPNDFIHRLYASVILRTLGTD